MRWLLAAVFLTPVFSQTRELSQYPVQSSLGNVTLAAEYLVHSIPAPKGMIFAEDYLVVDAAFHGRGAQKLSASQFTLRINGKKSVVYPQTPAWVASTIRDPAWAGQKPQLTVGGGIGNAGVILGRPGPVERFPGDPTARQPRPPGSPVKLEQAEVPLAEQLQLAAMPEGERTLPVSGFLYFAFKGKLKSIKTLELHYDGPLGKAALKLL